MKKVSLNLLLVLPILLVCSCANGSKLDKFNTASLRNLLQTTSTYELEYTKGDDYYLVSKSSSVFTTIDNDEINNYVIGNDNTYYIHTSNGNVDKTEEANTAIDYFVENYMYGYKKLYSDNSLTFVEEITNSELTTGYSHYYKYKTVYMTADSLDSGYYVFINADTGILLEKTAYGPNSSLLEASNIKISTYSGF